MNSLITDITFQKNKQDRVNIFVDGEFACAMQHFVCVKHGLKVGMEISIETLQDWVLESDKEQALNKVANLLQHGLKTENQILTYLKTKGYDPILQQHVLEKLKQYDYVNDERYATLYVAQNSKKFGKRKLKFSLLQKGIAPKLAEQVVAQIESDENQLLGQATKFLKERTATPENLQKVAQHLAYKGYSWDDIAPVLEMLKKEKKEKL